jgi:hypothetical protein
MPCFDDGEYRCLFVVVFVTCLLFCSKSNNISLIGPVKQWHEAGWSQRGPSALRAACYTVAIGGLLCKLPQFFPS